MQRLKSALKIKLNLANPYLIKPQYCLLNPNNTKSQIIFDQKFQLNAHTSIMRFNFLDQQKCLGRKIGQYVSLNTSHHTAKFTPISSIDDVGFVEFLVKDQGKDSIGFQLNNLADNARVQIQGPKTHYIYQGFGKFAQTTQMQKGSYRYIGIIAESQSIAETYSLIESITQFYDNRTSISLLWLADNLDDFVLIQQMAKFNDMGKLNLNLMLNNFQNGWNGPFGRITEQSVDDFLPPIGQNTLIIITGRDKKEDHMNVCKVSGHKNILVI